jgi:threonylcarbamoyladenosine tRNA methylthiotransferase MtaB
MAISMKIAFYTLGCKVNQYETQAMTEAMSKDGFDIVSPDEKADIYVINSCTVTSESDRKTRQTVRHFKRCNPDSVIVLTGCMPQAFPKDAEALTQADIVMGNRNNGSLPELIKRFFSCGQRIIEIQEHKSGDKFSGGCISEFEKRTRCFVKIEDGCNRFCSYCIIPYSRGRVRSKPIEELKSELQSLSESGFSEVVLVGINLSAYGSDLGLNICDAVELAAAMNFKRIRLGSLEPDHLTDKIIERLSKIEKLCPQFHISLQSGCDNTLKAMNRHYTAEEYKQLCNKLRATFDDATLTTDIMVGFPSESEEDFKTSLNFANEIGFEKVHVFPYSPREGTKAAEMKQLDKAVKEQRSRIMIEETEKIRHDFLTRQIGRKVEVLFETRHEDGYTEGYTKNYTPVKARGNIPCSEIKEVTVTGVDGDFCTAE